MPLYRVLKVLDVGKHRYDVGDRIELDERRGEWLRTQHKAVAPIGNVSDVPALMKPKPTASRRCCGR